MAEYKRSDAHRKADRVYAEKHKPIHMTVSFKTDKDKEVGEALQKYLEESGITANAYIKKLVEEDLKNKKYLTKK